MPHQLSLYIWGIRLLSIQFAWILAIKCPSPTFHIPRRSRSKLESHTLDAKPKFYYKGIEAFGGLGDTSTYQKTKTSRMSRCDQLSLKPRSKSSKVSGSVCKEIIRAGLISTINGVKVHGVFLRISSKLNYKYNRSVWSAKYLWVFRDFTLFNVKTSSSRNVRQICNQFGRIVTALLRICFCFTMRALVIRKLLIAGSVPKHLWRVQCCQDACCDFIETKMCRKRD